jgi:hypothetical protein
MKKLALCAAVATAAMLALPTANVNAQPYVGAGYTHYDVWATTSTAISASKAKVPGALMTTTRWSSIKLMRAMWSAGCR